MVVEKPKRSVFGPSVVKREDEEVGEVSKGFTNNGGFLGSGKDDG